MIGSSLLFVVLTLLTQTGGIVFLFSLCFYGIVERTFTNKILRVSAKVFIFCALYFLSVVLVNPLLARQFGRAALPVLNNASLKPATVWTWLLNRHYVRPEMEGVVLSVASRLSQESPGTVVNYLDASFPYIDNFPLPPHLSHKDGRKVDLSFMYVDAETGVPTDEIPSIIGYGVCEPPLAGEEDRPNDCMQKGYWQYNLLQQIVPDGTKPNLLFDEARTSRLIKLLAADPAVGKIFIEPHLKTRLRLASPKVRYHGCQAVRHDDHVHIQLR